MRSGTLRGFGAQRETAQCLHNGSLGQAAARWAAVTVAARKRGDGLANPSKLDAAAIGVRGAVADWRRVACVAGEGGVQGVEEGGWGAA